VLAEVLYMTNSLREAWTRAQPAPCTNATGPTQKDEGPNDRPRGVLVFPAGVEHGRLTPSEDLADFVEHYWWVRWDVPSPSVSEVLSYPSVHVVCEADEARVVGVVRGRFTRRVEGQGSVFGIKFHPGMFRAFSAEPAFRLTSRSRPLADELGEGGGSLARRLRRASSAVERATLSEGVLRDARPGRPASALLARDIVLRVRQDGSLQSVAAVAGVAGMSERALQRLFRDYVGVSPKWVVQRFRLQEAAERLATGSETVAAVAAMLGYFDQAHFVRDFKSVVGRTPIEYVREAQRFSGKDSTP
jgi:AraC-like DNA-binding protein